MTAAAASTTALPFPPLERGSEWRKWDLHIHTPASALNNQFPKKNGAPDWDAYIQKLETLQDVAAIGITDYFSVEGYIEVLNYRRAGRLQNVALVLPNIELRLDNLVPVDGKQKRLNLHVIFSDKLSPDQINEHFLRELKFTYASEAQGDNEKWSLTRAQLEALGRRLKREHNFTGSDFEVGCTYATVKFDDVKELLEGRPSVFREKYLIVLAEEGTEEIDWNGQGQP